MKYYIIAGEASGDLHGSNLIKEIKLLDKEAEIRAWGGELMEKQGAVLAKHYRDLAFMGFLEVLLNLRTIVKNLKFCKEDILAFQPDAVVLIDYPGFNMRIAKFLNQKNSKVFYYISPQIWAWKQNRVHQLKKTVDKMFVILPFEKEFYAKFNMEVEFVGHPLVDAIEAYHPDTNFQEEFRKSKGLLDKKIIALLPGSRKQEVAKVLPIMLSQVKEFTNYHFVIAGAPGLEESFLKQFIVEGIQVSVVYNHTYDLLNMASAALVTSGTATLETALFRVPEVVCYKGGFISYHIAKRILDIKYISLVNLIMDEEIVKELIQGELNQELLRKELGKLLEEGSVRQRMMDNFNLLTERLGSGGASTKTAQLIYADLK